MRSLLLFSIYSIATYIGASTKACSWCRFAKKKIQQAYLLRGWCRYLSNVVGAVQRQF